MNGIVINEDNSHYFLSRGIDGADLPELKELTAHYCVGQVSEIVYNFMAQRANVAGLNADPIWHGVEDKGEEGLFFRGRKLDDRMADWIRCARILHEKGIDPYQVWLEETRRRGRRAALSMRMNDCHDIWDEDHFFHAEFWRSHPEFRLYPAARENGYPLYCVSALDYTCAEVRAYKLAIIKSVLERYDTDGLEIDWMRHGNNCGLQNMDAGRAAITDFHREVRLMADAAEKRLGHPVQISARVSAAPDDAFARGLDVPQWIRDGSVQRVIPTAFFSTSDTGMPIALWRSILGKNAELCAGLELLIRPFPNSDFITETTSLLAGQAADYLHQGADRIYLFNHMDSQTAMRDPEDYREALETVGALETACAAHRRHVITYQDTAAFGLSSRSVLPATLPAEGVSGHYRIFCGPGPEKGRKCTLILGTDTADVPDLEVWMNCRKLSFVRSFINPDCGKDERAYGPFQTKQYFPKSSVSIAEFDAADAVVSGSNLIWLKNKGGSEVCNITWLEIDIGQA